METIFNDIAREIKENTNKTVNKNISSLKLEFGTITSSGLKLDNFKYEIQDYKILDYLNLPNEYKTETAGEYSHEHVIKNPKELRPLSINDRVLVATVGSEFVVIGRVTNA